MKILRTLFIFTALSTACGASGAAQPVLKEDYAYSLKIPSVVAMESSAAHLYVLSKSEGMAVFRTRRDSLQWLYTASGMQQRGHNIRADIRFAYLFGNRRRLTVLEPTSVMGAYSATALPQKPLDALRFGDHLYVALGAGGLGKLTLKTPETLDSTVQPVDSVKLSDQTITDLEASPDKLFALSAHSRIFIFNKNDRDISFERSVSAGQPINHIFFVSNRLIGSNASGMIFTITETGRLSQIGKIGEPVEQIKTWKKWLIIKGTSGRLWTSYKFHTPAIWKKNGAAGNYLATSKGQLWLCQYGRISRVQQDTTETVLNDKGQTPRVNNTADLKMQPIQNQQIPYPHALLIPLKLKNNFPPGNVQFDVETDVKGAKIRGQSLYWKPSSGETGEHHFKVIASTPDGKTSSVDFTVNVSRFNTPPRFTPLRTISIPVGRAFNLPIKAIDPDATNKNLIRYLGVNLPKGATVDEQTGRFKWTPTDRQLGQNSFRVIATDQYGAAASEDVTIKVIKTNEQKGQ